MSVIPTFIEKFDSSIAQIAFEYSPEIIFIIDKDNYAIIDANRIACETFLYTREELLQLTLCHIKLSDEVTLLKSAFKNALYNGTIETIETELFKKDYTIFEAEIKLRSAKYLEKTFVVASVRSAENSKINKSEKALQNTVTSYISDAIISADNNFKINSWNKTAEKVFGWMSHEVIGKDLREILNVKYYNSDYEQSLKELSENGSWTGEVIHYGKNCNPFPANVAVALIKDSKGRNNGLVGIIRDISNQKENENKIAYLAQMVNKVTDAIISADRNYIIKSWNNGAQKIYGYAEDELLGKSFLNIFNAEITLEKVERIYNHIHKNGSWNGEGVHYTKAGKKVYMLMSATPLSRNNEGEITEYVLIAKDISERKKLEDELNILNKELSARVKIKTAELVNAFERITDAFVAIDKDWRCTYMNKKAGEIFKREPANFVGKNIWEEFPESVGKLFYQNYVKAMETQQFIRMEEYYEPNQQWFEDLIYPSANGLSVYLKDITERKNAETKLIASEKLFKSLIENNAHGLALLSKDGFILNVSASVERIIGISNEKLIGTNRIDFVILEDLQKIYDVFEKCLENPSKPLTIEYRIKVPNDGIRYIEATYNNLLHKPFVNAIVMNFYDISERKNAEHELKKSEARHKLAQAQGKLGHWELNLSNNTLFWSEEVYQLFGMDQLTVPPDFTSFYNMIHPDDLNHFQKQQLNSIEEGKKVDFDYRIILSDGRIACLREIGERVNDKYGNPIMLAGTVQDVTEQKNTEAMLIESEKKYRLLFDSSPEPMWIYELNTNRFIEVNKAALDLYGYERDEFLLKTANELLVKETNVDWQQTEESVEMEELKNKNYFLHKKKNNQIITVEVISNIINFKNTKAKLELISNRTQQAKTERNLMATTRQLREFASHLQNIREEERTGIAREIHDELGQQLTGLKMDLSWLNKKLESNDESIQNKIKDSLQLVDSTINTVRKIASRLRPGILDDLGLAEAIEWDSGEFEKRTGVEVYFLSDLYDVKLSPDITIGVYRIFQEALTNVARHAQATQVHCTLQKHAGHLRLTVSDNGIGFDSKVKGHRKTLGLLGLKERVTILNGRYKIESEPGKGTNILIKVPLQKI